MKKLITILLFLFISTLYGQNIIDDFINKLESAQTNSNRKSIVDNFLSKTKKDGIPIIENGIAHFIYCGNVESVNLASDINDWNDSSIAFNKINNTNIFYHSIILENNARIDYKLIIDNKTWILDPENPNTIEGGFGENSELAMSKYIPPKEIIYNKQIPHGEIILQKVNSKITNNKYNVTIYLPPNYSKNNNKKYPTIYFQDGTEYIELGASVNILDNLIHNKKIEPIIAIFIAPTNRNKEYAFKKRTKYIKFFAKELVPYIDKQFRTIDNPKKRAVVGDSYGANISALISYHYPKLFGNCGLHSSAFQPNSFEVINLYKNKTNLDINFYAVWGTYEKSVEKTMNTFIEIVSEKNCTIKYNTYPEGHSWGLWRATTDEMLEHFFPYLKNTSNKN